MKTVPRFATLLEAASFGFCLCLSPHADAQTAQSSANDGAAASHKVPMHPSALTVRPHAHAKGRHQNYAHDASHQPTPIHGTMAGPRM